MSKKRRRKKIKRHETKLEIGKFYNVHDGSINGHPGRIEKIDEINDIFVSTTTGSMSKEEYERNPIRNNHEELIHSTDNKVYKSFINKKPFIGSRDDYGDKQYPDMKYHKDDLPKVDRVLKRKPRFGYWYKRRQK